MEIFQIVSFGIVVTIISIIMKKYKPELSVHIAVIAGITIFMMLISKLSVVFGLLDDLTHKINVEIIYFATVLKIIGIAYITEFGAEVCRDAGEGTIAMKLEFAGKILILVLAAPIIYALLELVVKIMP